MFEKTLKKSVKIADKVLEGILDSKDLIDINNKYFPQNEDRKLPQKRAVRHMNKPKRLNMIEASIDEKFRSCAVLQKSTDISDGIVILNQARVEKLYEKLSGFAVSSVGCKDLCKEDLYEVFNAFVSTTPNSEVLRFPSILKSLKYFREEYIDSEDQDLKSLAKLSHKLYLYWRSAAYAEYFEEAKERYMGTDQCEEDSSDEPKRKKTSAN